MAVIALNSPEDWEWRPNFVPDLTAPSDGMDRIIGKYDLKRPPPGSPAGTGMVSCGLNNCHRKHFVGFLVLMKDGRETIIGQDCGERETGNQWKEIHAVFRAEQRLHDLRQAIQNIQDSRVSLLARAKALLEPAARAHESVSKVRAELHKFQGFWGHIHTVARMDGRVMGRVEDDGESKRSTGKEAIEVKARISECSLLLEDTSAHHRALRFKVVHWLETDLEPAIEAARDDLKALAAVTKQSSELEGHIQEAEAFIARSEIFLQQGNLAGLSAIEEYMLAKHQKSNALTRALRRCSAAHPS